MSDHDARALATHRRYANRHSPTNDGIERDADLVGVLGERAFCRETGLPLDKLPDARTRGYQFVVAGVRVKVASTRTPGHLFVKQRKRGPAADAYVLAAVEGDGAVLVGWATREDVAAAPVRDPSKDGHGLVAHAIPARRLRPVSDLLVRLGVLDGPAEGVSRDGVENGIVGGVSPAPVQIGLGLDVGRDWRG